MALSFVTGAPGSGKSTVANELLRRGHAIYDTDDPNHTGIAGWHDLATGQYVAGFNELEVTEDLLATHVWRLTDSGLSDFVQRSANERIFLSGRLREAEAVIRASKYVVFLATPSEIIDQRLRQRAQIPGEVEWGREEWQIERSIAVNQAIEQEYRALGAIMINADQEIGVVVDTILDVTAE